MKKFVFLYCLLFISGFIPRIYSLKCDLPKGCRLEKVFDQSTPNIRDKFYFIILTTICDIDKDSFEFKFQEPSLANSSDQKCDNYDPMRNYIYVIFKWTSNELRIFDNRLNFSNVMRYYSYFNNIRLLKIEFWDVKGFDVNIFKDENLIVAKPPIGIISLSKCRLDFYYNKKKISFCQEIIDFNMTQFNSIFQSPSSQIVLRNMENNENICPLVFLNSKIDYFFLMKMSDTFYKRNILSFSNDTYTNLNSDIKIFSMYNIDNVKIDTNLLNPSIFNQTRILAIISGSLNSIDGAVFKHLKRLSRIDIHPNIFRKINHKQGINWIKQMNFDVNVNLSNISDSKRTPMEIAVLSSNFMTRALPDTDFCIYVDFPFNQLVVIDYDNFENDLTCTFLWLNRFCEAFYKLFQKTNRSTYYLKKFMDFDSTAIKSSISKCKFEQKINLCNKSSYKTEYIWDQNDFLNLNKKIQTAFKILLYPISLLGLITNLIVVLVILYKDNRDLFKEYKQYTYLWLNSLFCILISLIELLSWMTECFYPFEVFCPEIRKLVAIQFFKIIFHECFVTMLRFMCNFTYIGFALNRISLIGKDHGKIITFMSELGVKKYIGITFLISAIFSWIKGFKYEVNYFYEELNFPMSNEMDIMNTVIKIQFNDFYFIFNSISDLVNYLLFVVICMIIDICMVVQLRRTLKEKAKKSESINQKQNQNNIKDEFEEAVNKAIKMVVLNSAIGICFKLPVCFIPMLNLYAQFYSNREYHRSHSSFGFFYSMFIDAGFYVLIQDISNLFFTLSLTIQMFIYNRFDKKFRIGYERIVEKIFNKIKDLF